MNPLIDANSLYDAGTLAIKSSSFKYKTQLFEMNHLLETALLQKELQEGTYRPEKGTKFLIHERGKIRYITSNTMRDKTVNHVLCDEIVTPSIEKYLIYDNSASQKGKGISFARKRLEEHLHSYYRKYGTNDGYILLMDFSGYYANIPHDKCKDILYRMVFRDGLEEEPTKTVIENIFKSYEMDVSYMSDKEIKVLYSTKVDPVMNQNVPKELLTEQKMLKKGADIGNQLAQAIGITFPYKIDNYVKIVRGCKFYARYTDDSYIISSDREFLFDVLDGIKEIADEHGIILNKKKTRIVKISSFFRFMQIGYSLTATGKVIKKINPKNVRRERVKLKKYKNLLDNGKMTYADIENCFKSWICTYWKIMSHQQLYNMNTLYKELFGKGIKWKTKNSRLHWLMEHKSPDFR